MRVQLQQRHVARLRRSDADCKLSREKCQHIASTQAAIVHESGMLHGPPERSCSPRRSTR